MRVMDLKNFLRDTEGLEVIAVHDMGVIALRINGEVVASFKKEQASIVAGAICAGLVHLIDDEKAKGYLNTVASGMEKLEELMLEGKC